MKGKDIMPVEFEVTALFEVEDKLVKKVKNHMPRDIYLDTRGI